MLFDPEYEVRIANQRVAADRAAMANIRAAQSLGGQPLRRAMDRALLRVSRGAVRREAERNAISPPGSFAVR